jgi:tetratricopeptide (TPR) repeat protein/transglutaminase-like putative cysteine protease
VGKPILAVRPSPYQPVSYITLQRNSKSLHFSSRRGKNIQLMCEYKCRFVLFFLSCLAVDLAIAQSTVKPPAIQPAAAPADYSKEAFVDENDVTKISFANDGTGTREWLLRIRIQSDAGVQRYSVLTFPYEGATEKLDIDYVRVRKPDGTVIVTTPDSFQDMPSQVTREAPFYSDLHEKQVAVKGLAVGDVLESHAQWHVLKPLAPGQFWYAFNFSRDFIVLHQELQISTPRDRAVKWKSPDAKPVITEEGGQRIFTWTSSQLEHKSADAEKKDQDNKLYEASRGKLPPPDIQISSFQTWQEIGAWYNSLQKERVQPSPEIRAKALELTKAAGDENAKLRAIYNYVSTQFRYIGVAFGIGRYQPHAAAEVLANQYGDCKDKHTFLASLLRAAGIEAYPALINTYRELDQDVPSPAQFDHVITAVPEGSGYLWLDSTAEVAPFGYLLSLLDDKPALVIPDDKPAALVTTPARPTMAAVQTFRLKAKLDESGTLKGTVERSVHGDDAEVLIRSAFRRTPLTQWKDLVQKLSYSSGFSGDVSDVTASSPEKTSEPFHWSYTYIRKDFPQWSDHRIGSPLPPLLSAAADEKPNHPLFLGPISEFRYESEVEIPKGYSPQLPPNVDLKEDFADYHALYSVNNGVIRTERTMLLKLEDVSDAEWEKYKKFNKAVLDDTDTMTGLTQRHLTPATYQEAIWTLPRSDRPDAARAYDDAQESYNRRDIDGETAALRHAIELDPKYTRARLWLSEIYFYQRDPQRALELLHAAIDNDPQQTLSYKGLGFALMRQRKFDEAIPVWQQLMKVAPDDYDGPEYLASTFFAAKRYSEAAASAEAAIKLEPDEPTLYMQLGSAYLRSGKPDQALTAFKKTVEMDPRPVRFNDIGYELADANQQLSLALQYAEKAVKDEEEISAKVTLPELKKEDLSYTLSLAAFWDTMGWVHFRLGNYDKAEQYLYPAWMLTQGPTEADHLGQVYEQLHKKDEAIRMYRLSLAAARAPDQMKEVQARLEKLGGALKTGRFGANGTEELNNLRTFQLQRIISTDESADFFLLFTQGGKVAEVKFVSGSDKLKTADTAIRAANVHVPLPDDGPTHIVRRGVLGCYKYSGCTLVLVSPFDVHSVD